MRLPAIERDGEQVGLRRHPASRSTEEMLPFPRRFVGRNLFDEEVLGRLLEPTGNAGQIGGEIRKIADAPRFVRLRPLHAGIPGLRHEDWPE